LKGARVGVPRELFGEGVDADVRARVEEAIEAYRELGAEIVDVELPHAKYSIAVYYILATAEASSNLARYDGVRYGLRVAQGELGEMYQRTRAEGFGQEVRRRILIGTYVLSAGYYEAYYLRAQKVRAMVKRDFDEVFASGVHAVLAPATPSPAFALGEKGKNDPTEMYLNDVFTVPVNLAGLPAISMPAGLSDEGLPLGLQLIGQPFDEETLFSVAHVIEQAAGHFAPERWW
jgi:aspartyl-tRNA(Asn)/glutamyl-tRNA(Gln) amidotransferase subunit A